MTASALLRGLFVTAALGASAAPVGAQTSPPESPQVKMTVALVDIAAAVVNHSGSLAAFRAPEARGMFQPESADMVIG